MALILLQPFFLPQGVWFQPLLSSIYLILFVRLFNRSSSNTLLYILEYPFTISKQTILIKIKVDKKIQSKGRVKKRGIFPIASSDITLNICFRINSGRVLRLSCFKFSAAVAAVFAAQLRSSYEFNTGLTRHVTLDKLTSNKRPAACHKDSKKYSFLPIKALHIYPNYASQSYPSNIILRPFQTWWSLVRHRPLESR